MRIALDYTTGIYPGAGVARYTRSLVAALARLDKKNHYALFYAARGLPRPTPETAQTDALLASHPNFRSVPIPVSVRQMFVAWHRLRLPLNVEIFTGPCDVVHSPDFVSPPHRTGADVITVHDLSFLVVPECAEPKLAAFLGKAVPRAVERADHVIAVSEQTKRDLVSLMGVSEDKITVAHNGVDPRFKPMDQVSGGGDRGSGIRKPERAAEELRRKLNLPERFILHVGTLEPRKNLARLIEAYGLLIRKSQLIPNPQSPIPHIALVLAGRKGWLFEPILAAAERVNGAGGRVIFVDYVYDDELPILYNCATAFAYPSLYEGFGLPVAEALRSGVPTLVSSDGALAEVVGDAALVVDPHSVEEIAAGLERLLMDDELRARLAADGPKQVARFTWDAAAGKVLVIYKQVGRAN